MGYSMDAVTSDCYEGTTCLINKLDIRDEKQLSMDTILIFRKLILTI
jgi:cell filamentation protein